MITAPKDAYGVEFFSLMVHELTMKRVCALLDVHPTTVLRWLRGAVPVPKVACLALFWESRWGRSVIDSDHLNEIQLMRQHIRILEDQVVKAKDIITGLRQMQYGTANEPLYDELREFDHTTADTPPKTQIG
jgi:hypothetical protein